MSVDYNDKLGQAVKQARVQSHMTQEQLAEILNISATHLKSIERGERYPSFKLLEKLVRELSLSLDTIFLCGHEYTESMVYGNTKYAPSLFAGTARNAFCNDKRFAQRTLITKKEGHKSIAPSLPISLTYIAIYQAQHS